MAIKKTSTSSPNKIMTNLDKMDAAIQAVSSQLKLAYFLFRCCFIGLGKTKLNNDNHKKTVTYPSNRMIPS